MPATPVPDAQQRKRQRATARQSRRAFLATRTAEQRILLEEALAEQIRPHLGPPAILGSYAAVADEIGTEAIERMALRLGWQLAFPRVTDGPLSYHLLDRSQLAPGHRGILEPTGALAGAPVRPDVVLVPLLSVDPAGHRLGQGGGHYDRTLAALRADGPILAIGVCWDVQIVAHVAAREWDQPLDAIATPSAFHLGLSPGPSAR